MTDQPNEGWIKHDGGKCPVMPETEVQVRFNSGGLGFGGWRPASGWDWTETGTYGIAEYLPRKPPLTSSEADRLRERVKAVSDALPGGYVTTRSSGHQLAFKRKGSFVVEWIGEDSRVRANAFHDAMRALLNPEASNGQ